ncbi:MAG: DNA primase [Desulfuromonas sp.]|nr:MAG: DNA primase [Desulfuromonas sp.]
MSGQISESKIAEVRERTDIIELVSQYVTLKRAGNNHTGLCPFHSEKSPSFSVNDAQQFFHCFGCGVGGDVFSFLMKIEGLAFPDAVRRLAERAGIDLEERTLTPEEERRQQQRERFFRVNELASAYFHRMLMELPAGEPGRTYMRTRGYGRKAAEEYRIGYAPEAWEGLRRHLEEQGCQAEDVRALGLTRPSKEGREDYDLFRGRLIFPIYDLSGRVVAFAGRVLDDGKPKYINSPESPIYHKGSVLFGLFQARQALRRSGEVILVEGYFDQLALYRAGFPQVVATCGTALTTDHARILKRFVQRVLLLFDQDAAGRQATFKAMAILQQEGVPAVVVELPAGEDPDSFVQGYGAEAFGEKLGAARPAMNVFMEEVLTGTVSVEEKVRAAETILERIASLSSELEQDLYLKELAAHSGIELELLKRKSTEVRPQPQETRPVRGARAPHAESDEPPPPPDDYLPPADEYPPPFSHDEPDRPPEPVSECKAAAPWSRTEELLMRLLVNSPDARDAFVAADGEALLTGRGSAELVGQLLAAGTVVDDSAAFAECCGAEQALLLERFRISDPELLGENIGAQLDDCLGALRRDRNKRRRDELLVLIRRVEQTGDVEKTKDLLAEFHSLK